MLGLKAVRNITCQLLLCVAPTMGLADGTYNKARQTWSVAPFTSIIILGSRDARAGIYFSYQTQRPEKRFTVLGHRLDLGLEYGIAYSYGGGWDNRPHDQTVSYSILTLAKYENLGPSGKGIYYEVGFGLNYASKVTFDLDSNFNSTPTFGFGWVSGKQSGVRSIGLRYYHISNAGTNRPNQGQNQLMILTSFAL